ncbi:hypothetical protein [Kitasatospora sp. NPDC088783]|uniref:hypothetical protein n=1 Tax=Kitasatospora sp. NPDC088783 TaxID=3364077 RepID=UPI00383074AD
MPVRAEVLLTDDRGRILVTGSGQDTALPGEPVPPGESPAQTARLAAARLGLDAGPGPLLLVDWPERSLPRPPGAELVQVCIYGHRPLTAADVHALTADPAGSGPRLVDADSLDPGAPATARIRKALATRAVPADAPLPAPPGTGSVLAQLLLTAPDGRILLTPLGPYPPQYDLPGAAPEGGERPTAAASRAASAATGLIAFTPGRLLAADWRESPDGPGPVLVHIYDHPPLNHAQAAALDADVGNLRAPVLLHPSAAVHTQRGTAIGAALAARTEGGFAELEYGRPRSPGTLDWYPLHLLERPESGPGLWRPGPPGTDAEVRQVRAWLLWPDGRVLVDHHPASRATHLPGAPTGGAGAQEVFDRAVCGLALVTVPRVIGHHTDTSGTFDLRFLAPLTAAIPPPAQDGTVRLLMTPRQAAELVHGPVDPVEIETVRRAAAALGLPSDPARQPVTEIAAGIPPW